MADSFLYNIVHYPDMPTGDIKTLELLLVIGKHYDYDVSLSPPTRPLPSQPN